MGGTTTALTNGQAYTYKVFQKDTNGNYNTGINIGSFTPSDICYSQNTGNWSSGNTWTGGCSGANGIPTEGDIVTISSGTTVTVDGSQAADKITINASGTLTFASGASLTLNGTNGTLLTNNGTFTSVTDSTVVISSPTAPTAVLAGDFTDANALYNLTFSPIITGAVNYNIGVAFSTNGSFTIDPTSSGTNNLTVTLGGSTIITGSTDIRAEISATSVLDTGSNYSLISGPIGIDTGGTLDANNSTITINGSLSGTGVFNPGQSTIAFDGGGLITIQGFTNFYNLQTNNSWLMLSNPITINGNLSIPSGYLIDNGYQITGNSAGTLSLGAEALLALDSGLAFGSVETTVSSFPSLFTREHIDLDPGGIVYYMSESTQAISSVPIYGVIVLLGNGTTAKTASDDIVITGDWVIDVDNPAQFQPGTYTVYLSGTDGSTQQIIGNTTFNNLVATTLSNSAGRIIQFESGSVTTVTGTLTMTGEVGRILTLGSTDIDPWTITPASAIVRYLNVSNSINTNGAICTSNSTDGGGNTGWNFTAGSCGSIPNVPSLDSPSNETANVQTTLTFKTTAVDADNDFLQYKIILCEDLAMSVNCQTFDQTLSQSGWIGKNANQGSAYLSGTQAKYNYLNGLNNEKTYFWKSYAIDPLGINSWSSTQSAPYSFTTRTANQTKIPKIKGKIYVFGGTVIK